MKKISINVLCVLAGMLISTAIFSLFFQPEKNLGASYTQLTDTLDTLRINVNALNSQMINATSVDPGHIHSINSATGTITSASTTNITASGYGSFTGAFFTNATGTNLTNTGTASTSILFSASSTLSGTKTFKDSTTTLSASNFLSNSTSTGIVLRADDGNCYLIHLGTSGAFATSTASCN